MQELEQIPESQLGQVLEFVRSLQALQANPTKFPVKCGKLI